MKSPLSHVQPPRDVINAWCSCKGGLRGRCKHVCAIVLFVNNDSSLKGSTVTMQQEWSKLSTSFDYEMEKKVKDTFLSKCDDIEDLGAIDPSDAMSHLQLIDGPTQDELLPEMVASFKRNEAEPREMKLPSEMEAVFLFDRNCFHAYETISIDPEGLQMKVKKISLLDCLNSETLHFYRQHIYADDEKQKQIARETIGQSSNSKWHEERKLRITSTCCHPIKTWRKDLSLLPPKLKCTFFNASMEYGRLLEPVAREAFQKQEHVSVAEVGLFCHPQQSWLCCSPDGLYWKENSLHLLEIKCPKTCEHGYIIDRLSKKSMVPYLTFDEKGCPMLRETHQYYTQVQIALYVLGIKSCSFFTYSRHDQVTVHVSYDDSFLQAVIPRLEHFFFKIYLPYMMEEQS
ncbi:unnamed protein product [Darwinula stevensoni]|uniref:SWIM-type domain-containing protein n=1 Tax=Darwinula stevensoni TaxID=69355 RepID=A0A7R9ACW4_9CRUS|nr:unnamed protein product [Darwinula stevensoni]CAG0900553.1 unnamed protein product [Darwinula stevensoni]